ncbi:MAG: hypothetical protein Q7R30_06980, partial [Acidobacteriota bacterium]|nr:hypothetical protein [Acidobacteriota bacterium]
MAMRQRSQQLEMQHRERMAMIERGQVPIDPPQLAHRFIGGGGGRSGAAGSRSMSLGIIVIAVGLGLMTIVSIAGGSPEAGVGVGGAIVILGLAFIANSLVSRNTVPDAPPAPRQDDLR